MAYEQTLLLEIIKVFFASLFIGKGYVYSGTALEEQIAISTLPFPSMVFGNEYIVIACFCFFYRFDLW